MSSSDDGATPSAKRQRPERASNPWTSAEDTELLAIVQKLSANLAEGAVFDDWKAVAKQIPSKRTSKQCKDRFRSKLDPSINHGPWRDDEDEQLLRLSEEFPRQWSKIARALQGRTEHAVKSRVATLARLRVKDWTPEEDALLQRLKEEDKLDFEAIAPRFPSRSVHSIKKHWERLYMNTLAASIRSQRPPDPAAPPPAFLAPPVPSFAPRSPVHFPTFDIPAAFPATAAAASLVTPVDPSQPASPARLPGASSRLKKHSTSMTVLLQLIGDPFPEPAAMYSPARPALSSNHEQLEQPYPQPVPSQTLYPQPLFNPLLPKPDDSLFSNMESFLQQRRASEDEKRPSLLGSTNPPSRFNSNPLSDT